MLQFSLLALFFTQPNINKLSTQLNINKLSSIHHIHVHTHTPGREAESIYTHTAGACEKTPYCSPSKHVSRSTADKLVHGCLATISNLVVNWVKWPFSQS